MNGVSTTTSNRAVASAAPVIECWKCGSDRGIAPLCPSCHTIQPVVPGSSYFAALGLPEIWSVDAARLERAYLKLSRQVHPDRFSRASALERRLALEQTTSINDAYLTLREPRRRAEYLLARRGGEPVAEGERATDSAFLLEMMELREGLAEATTHARAEELISGVSRRVDAQYDILRRFFDLGEGSLTTARQVLLELRFLERFLAEAESRFAD